jgi:hypothetical protein
LVGWAAAALLACCRLRRRGARTIRIG